MRKLVFIGFVFPLLSWAQNLVPNPSFEDQNYCAPAEITNFGISGVLMDWYKSNTATPDYFNNCWMVPPPQNSNYQVADGDGFIGLCTYTTSFAGSNIREYASSTLLSTLLPGRWYDVSFYARIKNQMSRFASNNLGIHFSDTMLHANTPYVFNLNTPPLLDAQVKYFNNEIISDSAHWTLVRGLYQAHGGEQYLTLGNFNTDAQTTQGMEYTDGIIWQTYFVIDMVSVIPLDNIQGGIPAKAGADTTIFINDTAFIGQKISNMPSNWYLLDGTLIASNTAGLYVSPQETTTYVVSHTLNGIFSADTVTVTVLAPINLVPNPSFEHCTTCHTGEFGPAPSQASLVDWYNPNISTPDYFTALDSPAIFSYQIPDSQAFIGLSVFDAFGTNLRDYASCSLLDTLQSGKWYDVSFYARIKNEMSRFASNNLGIHFSDTALLVNDSSVFNLHTPPLLDAQVKYFNNEIISDSAHWTLVRGLYQAHGGEQYLTLGNFNTDAQTTQGMEYTDGTNWQTYFVIDMVSVIPLDNIQGGIPAKAGADTTIFINDTAFIGQKISNMPSNWYLLDGTPLASNTAGLYVSPQETTTYVVSHILNGIFSADTVTVTVIDNLGLEEYATSNFSVFPNPNKGVFMIRMNEPLKSTTQLIISDNTGRILIQQTLESSAIEMSIETTIKPGVYFLLLQEFGKTGERKSIVIE